MYIFIARILQSVASAFLWIEVGGSIGPLLGSSIYQHVDKQLVFYVQGIALIIISILICTVLKEKSKLNIGNKLSINKQ